MRIVVVGGVAGGATAAARLRRLSEEAEIVLFERGYHVSYANCGLPYYVGGEIEKRDDLFVVSPERLKNRFRIDVRTSQEVVEIDRARREITIKDQRTGATFKESYDRLILSPGARPTKPPIPGIDLDRVFTLRDVPDSDRIKGYLDRNEIESAVVVGGGPIGLEMAQNLSLRRVRVTVVEMLKQVMPPLDYEMACIVHRHLREQGVLLVLGEGVKSFHEKGGQVVVTTESGREVEADMVLLSIGVRPEKALAEKAKLALGARGGIAVDEMLRTSDPHIYAVGDAVEVKDFISGESLLVPLAGPANKQGRAAADNALGRNSRFNGVLGTNVTRIFKMTAASTGNNEKRLKQTGIPYRKSFTHSFHHASYFPGARSIAVKLLFSPEDGKVLGSQIVGEEGVDKRIDVLATAIRAGMTVYDLEQLELAYAPQFGSAKDPINIAGFVASNILKGDVEVVHWDALDSLDWQEHVLLDVRTSPEVKETGKIRDALNIYVDDLRDRLPDLDRDKTYITYCTVSYRAYIAYRILVQNGFKARILGGGMETWLPLQEDKAAQESRTE
jgi:NADPH-dependent 2,4-dienoyl-CoA reductase/sulfur reductase-like enzyme/rhodanese-related sulfurtransferase